MGDWYVLANIPTYFEKDATNCIERYVWSAPRNLVEITFLYKPKSVGIALDSNLISERVNINTNEMTSTRMHGIISGPQNTRWLLNPKIMIYWALNLNYLILDIADDYSYVMVGVPDRSYLWIMTRDIPMSTQARDDKYASSNSLNNDSVNKLALPINIADDGKVYMEGDVITVQQELSALSKEADADEVEKLEQSINVLSLEAESAIMIRAYQTAAELGYDCSKIQRVIWE